MSDKPYYERVFFKTCEPFILDEYYKPKTNIFNILRYRISRFLGRSSRAPDYDFFWTTAILISGLHRMYESMGQEQAVDVIAGFFRKRFTEKEGFQEPLCLDSVMHGYALIKMYELNNISEYKRPINEMAKYLIEKHVKTSRGVLPYRSRMPEMVFIDTIGMVCPFLAYYGKIFDSEEATNLSVLQIKDFFEYGFDSNTGLPYHAYNSVTNEKKGCIGWGRGIGWIVYGVVDAIEHIPKSHPEYEKIIQRFRFFIDRLLQYQDENGYLKWQVNDCNSHVDTSATSMFGYALARGVLLGILNEQCMLRAELCLAALENSTDVDGTVQDCSGECIGLGKYSVEYGAYPWAQGPTLSLVAILKRE